VERSPRWLLLEILIGQTQEALVCEPQFSG
jgi:hypothetical protein